MNDRMRCERYSITAIVSHLIRVTQNCQNIRYVVFFWRMFVDNYAEKMSPILVVAFDIGTTYSGWAYSFKPESEADAFKVHIMQPPGGPQQSSCKVPTALFIPDHGQYSFGYKAESDYTCYSMDGNGDFMYFSRFKMALNDWDVNESTSVTAENDKSRYYSVLELFSLSLKFLLEDFRKTVEDRVLNIDFTTDIMYVVTVPAIWTDPAKYIMRKAATKAGIETDKLHLALEPEACSLCCRKLLTTKTSNENGVKVETLPVGTKYIVVDAGGGTVDVAVHEITENEKIRELYFASGGGWGGTLVDEAFEEFLDSLLGEGVYRRFQETEICDNIDMKNTWEGKKRQFSMEKKDCNMSLPLSLKELIKEDNLKVPQFKGKVTVKRNHMRLTGQVMQSFFRIPVNKTIDHLGRLLQLESLENVSVIFMAGGFSDCPLLTDAVKKSFPVQKVIIPPDASLATLKGAVMYGHSILKYKQTENTQDLIITQRVSKYTYGYESYGPFLAGTDPMSKLIMTDNGLRCSDYFNKVVEIGQTIDLTKALPASRLTNAFRGQDGGTFRLFASEDTDHTYTDEEGCRHIGTLDIVLPNPTQELGRELDIMFAFGGTELQVTARDVVTGHTAQCSLDFTSIEATLNSKPCVPDDITLESYVLDAFTDDK